MSTLYISDLDGTLLQPECCLSDYTVCGLRELILKRGIHFTVATARTAATVVGLMADVPLKMPVILMSGVLVYSIEARKYQSVMPLNRKAFFNVLDVIRRYNIPCFVYTLVDDIMNTYFEALSTPFMRRFYETRVAAGKKFTKTVSFTNISDDSLIFISASGRRDMLEPTVRELDNISEIRYELYHDVYDTDGTWLLEIANKNASKYTAVNYLQKTYGFDEIVCFGDNLNDLPMFDASDRCYAVANARDEVKSAADGIIGDNTSDGVIKWLLENT